MFGRKNIGIDLGTTSIRILVDKKGVVINDKSVSADFRYEFYNIAAEYLS